MGPSHDESRHLFRPGFLLKTRSPTLNLEASSDSLLMYSFFVTVVFHSTSYEQKIYIIICKVVASWHLLQVWLLDPFGQVCMSNMHISNGVTSS